MGIPHFQNHWLKDSTIGPVLASLVLSQFLVNIPAKGRKNSIPCAHVQSLSHVQLFVTPQTVAHQAPLSMGLSRQEYWSELPFPHPRDFPNPGIKPMSAVSPTLVGRFFTAEPPGKPSDSPCFLQFQPEFCNKEFMI